MDSLKRTILNIQFKNLPDIDRLFGKQAEVDMDRIPEKQRPLIMNTKDIAFNTFAVKAIYDTEKITSIEAKKVTFSSGSSIAGSTLPRVLADSTDVVCIAAALFGFEEACRQTDRTVEKYFMDSWATAIISAASRDLTKKLRDRLKHEGLYTTSVWSPGQHNIPIENQVAMFDILQPDDIGLFLKESLLMVPQKSETLLFGMGNIPVDSSKGPCDYCDRKPTCPSAQ